MTQKTTEECETAEIRTHSFLRYSFSSRFQHSRTSFRLSGKWEIDRIVLVRPRDPNNIGAAARAMKNFGFTDLAVVTPHPPVWGEVVSAVNATDVLDNARSLGALDEAIADCNLVSAQPTARGSKKSKPSTRHSI